jgi:hypothetical protein
LRDGQPRIDHPIDLRRFAALADARQAGGGGQVQLASLAHFTFRHVQWGAMQDSRK